MIYLFVPMFGLYMLGIVVCHYFPGTCGRGRGIRGGGGSRGIMQPSWVHLTPHSRTSSSSAPAPAARGCSPSAPPRCSPARPRPLRPARSRAAARPRPARRPRSVRPRPARPAPGQVPAHPQAAHRHRPGGQDRGAAQGRRPAHLRPRRRGGRGAARRPGLPTRSSPA